MRIAYRGLPIVALAAALSACASSSEDIKAASVNPDTYAYMTCDQLADYNLKLQATYKEADDQESDARAEDAVGYVLLQQPLGSQRHYQIPAEIADLKGRMNAVHELEVSKNCGTQTATVSN